METNIVLSKFNADEIFDVILFCQTCGFHVKVFDIFNFGGKIDLAGCFVSADTVIEELRHESRETTPQRLPGERGIAMLTFLTPSNTHIMVVSHRGRYSSSKFYCDSCLDCCFYPCDTGRFQIPLRADGLLLGCRLYTEDGIMISGMPKSEVTQAFQAMFQKFADCYEL